MNFDMTVEFYTIYYSPPPYSWRAGCHRHHLASDERELHQRPRRSLAVQHLFCRHNRSVSRPAYTSTPANTASTARAAAVQVARAARRGGRTLLVDLGAGRSCSEPIVPAIDQVGHLVCGDLWIEADRPLRVWRRGGRSRDSRRGWRRRWRRPIPRGRHHGRGVLTRREAAAAAAAGQHPRIGHWDDCMTLRRWRWGGRRPMRWSATGSIRRNDVTSHWVWCCCC